MQIELTDEDVDAINEAEAEMGRGEHVDFDEFAAAMRAHYGVPPERPAAGA